MSTPAGWADESAIAAWQECVIACAKLTGSTNAHTVVTLRRSAAAYGWPDITLGWHTATDSVDASNVTTLTPTPSEDAVEQRVNRRALVLVVPNLRFPGCADSRPIASHTV